MLWVNRIGQVFIRRDLTNPVWSLQENMFVQSACNITLREPDQSDRLTFSTSSLPPPPWLMISLCGPKAGLDVLHSKERRRWGTLIMSFPSTLHVSNTTLCFTSDNSQFCCVLLDQFIKVWTSWWSTAVAGYPHPVNPSHQTFCWTNHFLIPDSVLKKELKHFPKAETRALLSIYETWYRWGKTLWTPMRFTGPNL